MFSINLCTYSTIDIGPQEMANPHVHPHLALYPKDAGLELEHAHQAEKWLHELPDDETTPML